MRSRLLAFVLASFLCGSLVLLVWRGEEGSQGIDASRSASSGTGVNLYRLQFASSDRFSPGVGMDRPEESAIESALELDVELSIERVESDAKGETRRLFRFSRCHSGSFRVGETKVIEGAEECEAELGASTLVIDYSESGELLRVHEPKASAPLFGELSSFVLSELSFWNPADGAEEVEAEVEEANLRGVAISHYHLEGSGEWSRTRQRYQSFMLTQHLQTPFEASVAGRHRLRMDGGSLREFVGAETVRLVTASGEPLSRSLIRIELQHLGGTDAHQPDFQASEYNTYGLGDADFSEELEKRMLLQQAAGLTREEFLETLSRFAGGGRLPDHDRFLWRSYALLQLEPKLAWELQLVFANGNSTARTLVLDLLAQVGHSEAQAVVVKLLQNEHAQNDPKAVELHQRLGLIDSPEQATVEYAENRYLDALNSDTDSWHYATAYTLGAVARHADAETSDRLREHLIADLDSASDAVEVRHLVTALGSAHNVDDLDQLTSYATSENADVRAAVATTLKDPQTELGLETLLMLVSDADRLAQHQAIRSLFSYALDQSHFEVLAARVSEGLVHQANFRALVELAKSFRANRPEGSELLLRAMIDFGITDNQVNAAAHLLLRSSRQF